MSGAAVKRITKELLDLDKLKLNQVHQIDETDIFNIVIILSNLNNPYDDGSFKLQINFPPDYPFNAPNCVMDTKIFHPNVDRKGNVCLKELVDNWSIMNTLTTIVEVVIDTINNPNPDDSLSPNIAKVFREDRETFMKTAKTWTSLYAQ